MFENSLVESRIRVPSLSVRWTAAASITLQLAAASLLVILPLLHTELLPSRASEVKVVLPLPAAPPPPRTVVQRASSALAAAVPMLGHILVAPRTTPSRIDSSAEPPSAGTAPFRMSDGPLPGGLVGTGNAPTMSVSVAKLPEKKVGPLRLSEGVIAGMLISPIRPVYPAIAKAAHVEGTVVVEAVISKTGNIESLHVVSGPAMLQTAALDAIRAARYQPFRLNNEPTEVQTTITVNFRMGS